MAEEQPIFAKKTATSTSSAGPAEQSIFQKAGKGTPAKKPKTGLIIGIIVAALAVIGGVVALILILVLNQPDYEKMDTALEEINESSLSSISGTDFAYLPNGRLTKTTHDRYVKNAKEDLEKFREHIDVIKTSADELEKAGAARSDVSKEYEKFKSQADDLLPKLEKAANDLDKYIEFSDRYYNSKLVVLDSYSTDYSSLKDLSDSEIDKIFQPLQEASSEKLRDFAGNMAKYIKTVAKFYKKYYKYMDGSATPTTSIQDELEKDSKEIEDLTNDVTDLSDISEDDIFDFTERDLTKFNETTEKLSNAVKKLI